MAPYKIADNTIHVSKSCSKKDTHTTAVSEYHTLIHLYKCSTKL